MCRHGCFIFSSICLFAAMARGAAPRWRAVNSWSHKRGARLGDIRLSYGVSKCAPVVATENVLLAGPRDYFSLVLVGRDRRSATTIPVLCKLRNA